MPEKLFPVETFPLRRLFVKLTTDAPGAMYIPVSLPVIIVAAMRIVPLVAYTPNWLNVVVQLSTLMTLEPLTPKPAKLAMTTLRDTVATALEYALTP